MENSYTSPLCEAVRQTLGRRGYLLLVGAVLGLVAGVDMVASLMASIAASHIQRGVGISPEEYIWTLTAYAVAATVMNLVLTQISLRIGLRSFMQAGLMVFMVGSVACGFSNNASGLFIGRMVQGIGGGALFAAARIFAQLYYPAADRGMVMNGFGFGATLCTAAAPWLTAVFVDQADWRAIFLLQAAMALPLPLLAAWILPARSFRPAAAKIGELDWHSFLPAAVGILLLLHGLGEMRYVRIDESPSLPLLLVGGVFALAYAGVRFHFHPDPWIDPRRLKNRVYLAGLAFYMIFYLLSGLWNYLLTVFLQGGLGFDFRTTAELLTLNGLATFVAMIIYAALVQRLWRRRRVVAFGYIVLAGASWWIAQCAMPGASREVLIPALLLQGVVMIPALVQTAAMTFVELPVEDFAHAYSLKNILRQLVAAVSTGWATLLVQESNANFRTFLVSHLNVSNPNVTLTGESAADRLVALSVLVDRQVTLLTCQQLFTGLALASLCVAVIVVGQRFMK